MGQRWIATGAGGPPLASTEAGVAAGLRRITESSAAERTTAALRRSKELAHWTRYLRAFNCAIVEQHPTGANGAATNGWGCQRSLEQTIRRARAVQVASRTGLRARRAQGWLSAGTGAKLLGDLGGQSAVAGEIVRYRAPAARHGASAAKAFTRIAGPPVQWRCPGRSARLEYSGQSPIRMYAEPRGKIDARISIYPGKTCS